MGAIRRIIPAGACLLYGLCVVPLDLAAGQDLPGEGDLIQPGMSLERLISIRGEPESNMALGSRQILKWEDLKVTAANGEVVSITWIDPEKAERKRLEHHKLAEARQAEIEERRKRILKERKTKEVSKPKAALLERGKLEELIRKAESGHRSSQVELGLYYQSQGDMPNAMKWLTEAAEDGSRRAKYELAMIYIEGVDAPYDPRKGLELMEESADDGYTKAQLALAESYATGKWTPTDPEEAYFWYWVAAVSGGKGSKAAQGKEAYEANLTPAQVREVEKRVAKYHVLKARKDRLR